MILDNLISDLLLIILQYGDNSSNCNIVKTSKGMYNYIKSIGYLTSMTMNLDSDRMDFIQKMYKHKKTLRHIICNNIDDPMVWVPYSVDIMSFNRCHFHKNKSIGKITHINIKIYPNNYIYWDEFIDLESINMMLYSNHDFKGINKLKNLKIINIIYGYDVNYEELLYNIKKLNSNINISLTSRYSIYRFV